MKVEGPEQGKNLKSTLERFQNAKPLNKLMGRMFKSNQKRGGWSLYGSCA